MKILIVDDTPENVYLLESLLKGHGYEVLTAVNGAAALEKLKQTPADLIISDILMPKMDGFQLCRAVKADNALKNIPFVFYTATYTNEKDKDFALSLGASRFILKPTDPEEFIGIIKEVLVEREQGVLAMGEISIDNETEYLKEHQARLIRKLGDKIIELEQSEERYRSLIACAIDAIITIDAQGYITSWNDGAEKIFGYSSGEAIGREFSLLVPEELQHEQGLLLQQLKERKLIGCLETVRKTKEGALIPVGLSLSLMRDKQGKGIGISAIIRDMSERKKAEQFVQDIFQSMGEGLAVIDRNYRILTANPAYCKMAKLGPEEIKGRACYEVSHHHKRPCDEDGLECPVSVSFRTGGPFLATHYHNDPDHGPVDVEVRSYPLKDRTGEINAVIEIVRDISVQKKLEAQLVQSQKMEAIGTLAGGIAHDFNNILSAIIGYGHLTLMKMQKDDPLRLNIEHMLESGDRAAALTQSLLTFSRKQITERKPVDLNSLLGKVEKFLVRVIGEDVAVRLGLAGGELFILADAGQLEQVFMNLATNARDAMPKGGSFMIETSIMDMDSAFVTANGYGKPGTYAMITVTDTGTGMDEEIRKKIFEPFFTSKEVGKGTGLGLAMVYGILAQNEGYINVYSEPGKGTTFRIYFPLIKAAAAEGRTENNDVSPIGGTETILLAEDDAELRKLSVIILEQAGYSVITANNGEEAVAKFMENKDRIELLLFDIIMPKKSGREACDEIQKASPTVPVLFVSGYSSDMLHEKALIGKEETVINKPVSPQVLLKRVRDMLDRKR